MRIRCNCCGKVVSTEVPEGTLVRAWTECPETTSQKRPPPGDGAEKGIQVIQGLPVILASLLGLGADLRTDMEVDSEVRLALRALLADCLKEIEKRDVQTP